MNNSVILSNRFREVILDGTWIANTNFKAQLINADWVLATTPYESLNTIALLAQHIHYYVQGIKNVFLGGTLDIRDSLSFSFAAINSQADWEAFLTTFWVDAEELANLIEQLPEYKLQEIFIDEQYGSWLRNIEGMIEHSYYHLGQITLIKKLLNA